jgi:hypothetical protein
MNAPASAQSKTGDTISVSCNLPHGLTIEHKGKSVTLAGSNHPKAIATSTALNGAWGITHNVDKAWLEDWAKVTGHPAYKNGNILAGPPTQVEDMVEEMGDAVETGTNPLDPDKPGPGLAKLEDEE